MDDAWCPVCDRLIPPKKHTFPVDSSLSSQPRDDAPVPNDLPSPTTTATNTKNPALQSQAPKRTKSKNGATLKTSASGRKLAKLAALNTKESTTTTTTAGAPQPPAATALTQQPPPPEESSLKANAASASNAGKSSTKAAKPRTVLTQPASLYCSEACRLADEHNYYTSTSVGGVGGVYSSSMGTMIGGGGGGGGSPSSSYQSATFVSPPLALSTSVPSRNSSHSRSRTRSTGGEDRRGSVGAINTSLANAVPTSSTSTNPYYLASPLLSPTPSFTSHQHQRHSQSRRTSSYSRSSNTRNGRDSDEESDIMPPPLNSSTLYGFEYAYDPDRANGDYFRSLQRGERQGYFTTPATIVSRSPPNGDNASSNSDGTGSTWDHIPGGSIGPRSSARHTTVGVFPHMSSMSTSSSASVSHSTRQRKTSQSSKGGKGTSAPAYVPTNGYLTHFSGLDIGAYRDRGVDGSFPYPSGAAYQYPYPDRGTRYGGGGAGGSGTGGGGGSGYGRSSNASTTSSGRRRSAGAASSTSPVLVGVGKERREMTTSGGVHLTKVPLFALEPHWPGPLSATSDSDSDDVTRDRRRRTSSSNNERERPESMTTAPSTESVQGLLTEMKLEEMQNELEMREGNVSGTGRGKAMRSGASSPTTATPRRPIPTRTRTSRTNTDNSTTSTMTVDDDEPMLRPQYLHSHSKSSASLRAGSTSTSRTVRKTDHQRNKSSSSSSAMIGGMASTAPAMHNPLSLSSSIPLSSSPLSTRSMHITSSSKSSNSKSSSKSKARPEHQHGLLVHVALPSFTSSSLPVSNHLKSLNLAAPMLPPSVSNVRASAEMFDLSSSTTTSSSTSPLPIRPTAPPSRSSLDELLQIPIQDSLPPRMDARSRMLAMNVSRARQAVAEFQQAQSQSQSQSVDIPPPSAPVDNNNNSRHGRSHSLTPAHSYRSKEPRLDSLAENDDEHSHHTPTTANQYKFPNTSTSKTPTTGFGAIMGMGVGGPLLPNTASPNANNGPSALFRNVSTQSLNGGNKGNGGVGLGVDLETYVPTYPMEMLPGNNGERRKRLFHFGGF